MKIYNLMKHNTLRVFMLLTLFQFVTQTSFSQVIATWDFSGESNQETSTADASNPNLSNIPVLSRGSEAAASAGGNSFRTVGFQNNGISTSNNDYFQFSITANAGYNTSISSIDARVTGTLSFCAAPGVSQQFAYSTDGINFTLIGSPSITASQNQSFSVNTASVTALQGIPAGTTVTFRFYASGQTTTGGWGFASVATPGTPGLQVNGTVALASGCTTTNTITATACGSYTLNSQTYTTSGQYTQTLEDANSQGCDSIITLNLTINSPFANTINQSICQGSSYTFGTQTLTTAGQYTQTFTSIQNGCDSVVTLNLTVLSQFNTTASASICQGETYSFGTQSLTTAGQFTETFQSIQGCDSIVSLTLTVNVPTTSTLTVTSCGNYTLNTETYTTAGTYTQVIDNVAGCDSTITLNLTINQPSTNSITETACGSFTLNGQTYNTTGTYTQTLVNAVNCDSIITLNLTINPQPGNVTLSGNQTICEGEEFEAFTATQEMGESLIISGIVDAQLPGGLPKAIVLYAIEDIADLSIYGLGSAVNGGGSVGVEFAFPQQTVTAGSFIYIASDSVNFNTFFGFYPQFKNDVANINGDDAVELFKNGTVIDAFGEVTVDGTDSPWEYMDGWAHRNSGSLPSGATFDISQWSFSGINIYDNQTTNASTPTPFPVGQFTTQNPVGTIKWYSDANLTTQVATGNTYTSPITSGTATYYVVSSINTCSSAVATVTATVAAAPTASATLANISELTATPAGMSYQWINCATETPIAGATSATYTATANGSYAVIVTNAAGCSDTSDCINVTQLSVSDLDELVSISLYPNPTSGIIHFTMNPELKANALVLDAQGKVVIKATNIENASEISLANFENGVYMVQLNTANGSKMFRVVKQ